MEETRSEAESTLSRNQWILWLGLVAVGLFLRFISLDARPVHHDESLHAMYGRYFYDFPDIQYYKYDPMLHGPFIYNLMRIAYSTFGCSTWAARAAIVIFGSVLLFMPYLFRRYFSKPAMLGLTAAVALSPTLIYWSRFIREDALILSMMSLMLYGCLLAPANRKWIWVLLAVVFQTCLKENVFVTLAILTGYLVYEVLFYRVTGKRDERTIAGDMWRNLKTYPWSGVVGFMLAAFVFCYIFSEGFRYPQGITDFFTKSISYWMNQHDIERIKGPFNFHLYTLAWYELPFIIAMVAQLWIFYRTAPFILSSTGAYFLLGSIICFFAYANTNVEAIAFWQLFKLKDSLDIAGLLIVISHSVLITTYHLMRGERYQAFWGYLFYASVFTYSYLGEKVPWLTVYPFAPGLIYFALFFDSYFKQKPINLWTSYPVEKIFSAIGMILFTLSVLFWFNDGISKDNLFFFGFACLFFAASYLDLVPGLLGKVNLRNFMMVLFCVYSLRAAVLTNIVYGGEAREYLSQVHTTREFHDTVIAIKKEITAPKGGYKPTICATGEMVWPITWYLIDTPEYRFPTAENPNACDGADYKFIDYSDKPDAPVPAGYKKIDLKLRGWWVPDFTKMSLKSFLNYSLNHTNWSDSGYTWTTLLVKER